MLFDAFFAVFAIENSWLFDEEFNIHHSDVCFTFFVLLESCSFFVVCVFGLKTLSIKLSVAASKAFSANQLCIK